MGQSVVYIVTGLGSQILVSDDCGRHQQRTTKTLVVTHRVARVLWFQFWYHMVVLDVLVLPEGAIKLFLFIPGSKSLVLP